TDGHLPLKIILAAVAALRGRNSFVPVFELFTNLPAPSAISVGDSHIGLPGLVHPDRRDREDQTNPGVPESRGRSTAQDGSHPVQLWRVECQPADQKVEVREAREP